MRLKSLRRRRTRRGKGPVVLLYHRIARTSSDPQLLCVSPEHFAEHVGLIAERYEPVRLAELVAALRGAELPREPSRLPSTTGTATTSAARSPSSSANGLPPRSSALQGGLEG